MKEKVTSIKDGGPTKAMLMERARDIDIEGRSGMNKDELVDALLE